MGFIQSKLHGEVLQEIELIDGSEYTIGRSSSCDICIDKFIKISRQHIKISQNRQGVWEARLISQFGSVVHNGEEVSSVTLNKDLSFHVLSYEITFHISKSLESDGEGVGLVPKGASLEKLYLEESNHLDVTADGLSELTPYLEFFGTEEPMEPIPLKDKTSWIIGRDDASDITIPQSIMSRRHFEITNRDGEFYISDLGSSNGTELNGISLQAGQDQIIGSHDLITIKDVRIRLLIKNESLGGNFLQEIPQTSFPVEMSDFVDTRGPDVVRLSPTDLPKTNKRKKMIYLAIGGLSLIIVYGLFSGKNPRSGTESADMSSKMEGRLFQSLSKEKQMIIKDTFNLARTHYTQGNYELCLSEIQKIHEEIPFYDSSKEIESLCRQGKHLFLKQEERNRREQIARQTNEIINITIQKCRSAIKNHTTLSELETCLYPAMERSPGNQEIERLLNGIKLRDQKRIEDRNKNKLYQSRVQRGLEKYNAAKRIYKVGSLQKAIHAYESYLKSSFPDPRRMKVKAKKELTSIRQKLKTRAHESIQECRRFLSHKDYKNAIKSCDVALSNEPSNKEAEDLRQRSISSLREKMKGIYNDAILEEQFGNIQAAREKWHQIMKESLASDEYFKKAKRKLRKYGMEI